MLDLLYAETFFSYVNLNTYVQINFGQSPCFRVAY